MQDFDVAIIGAGVVGCATARRLALAGYRVVLIERGTDILSGASKANSAILHTGFDAPPGTLELECMRAGYREYLEIRGRFGLPLIETGAMVVAWTEAEAQRLPSLLEIGQENGVDDLSLLDTAGVAAREPNLAPSRGALLVPGESIIDPWTPFLAYVLTALDHGAQVLRRTEVTGGAFDGQTWRLETTGGPVGARHVVNAAGLQGDRVEATLLGDASFEIRPRKGQFVVYDKPAARLLRTIVLPVPNERTKGVVLTQTVFGNLLVGPTAEEQDDRERPFLTTDALQALMARAEEMVPAIRRMPVNATYAGLRPATERKEYRIRHEPERHWITVGGIRSTGMTAALGLAQHVLGLIGGDVTQVERSRPMPILAEEGDRAWRHTGHGGIVCHCEQVTAGEIETALSGPLPALDLAGLKRRTRCTMGRCQGFNCLGRIAEITDGRLAVPVGAAP
jgi:glycerol-3-phosphate dehydrogenase